MTPNVNSTADPDAGDRPKYRALHPLWVFNFGQICAFTLTAGGGGVTCVFPQAQGLSEQLRRSMVPGAGRLGRLWRESEQQTGKYVTISLLGKYESQTKCCASVTEAELLRLLVISHFALFT